MQVQMGDKVVVRLGTRPARKATVITNTGALTYLAKYENGEMEQVSADTMALVKGKGRRPWH